MDSSPKSSKKNNTTTDSPSSNPVEIQESQIFTYLGNLSPIKPFKGVPAPKGFPGLNSPPLVFTSPTINSSSVSDLLKRPQLSGTGLSGKDEKFKEAVIVVGECGISNPQSSSGLTPCFQNAHPNDNSLPEKASSVSASSDDFLTNTVNMDCSAFTNSGVIPRSVDSLVDSAVSEVKHKYQDDNGKDEMITGISPLIKVKNDNGKDEMETGASPLISEQAEEMQVKSLSDLKPAEAVEKLGGGKATSEPHPTVEPNSHTDGAFNNQSSRCSTAEIAGADNEAELGCSSQLGSLHNVEQGNCGENSDVQYTEAGQETMQHDHILKVGPQQHGVRRRCLQFEDAQRKTIEKSVSAHNLSGSTGFPSSSSSLEVLEVLESSSRDKPAIPGTGLLANVIKPTFSSQHSGNYTMKVPKPSGIGLHLNSVVNAMQIGSGATVSLKSVERGSLSILGKKSSSTMSFHSLKNSSISLNQAEIVSASCEDCKHDNVDSTAASRTPSLSDMVKHMNEYLPFKPIQLQSNLCDKRKSSSENANSIDDSSPSSPKKKRKKTLDTDGNDGCKRCNCKKTKCLKLYCECFAAGIYCADPCSCQGCFNRPEYEDTVLETRQQIESRNPQAFAPKVVPHINEPSSSSCGDDEIRYTPPSARHKKGCNCKKSKCSKKYCECFQSNVGCCDGCRCEGCENGHGRKGDCGMVRNQVSKDDYDEILDGSYDKCGLVARGDNLPQNELCNPQNLTPSTPSIQCSNHGKNASKSWISSERYLPSPESGLSFLSPYGTSPGLILNPDNHGVILEANDDTMDLVAFDQKLEYGSGDTMNHFPPRFDGPTLPNPQNSENMLRIQMLSGNHQVSHASSLRWRSSSVSPMTHFGGTELFEVGNGGSYVMLNDDTPEVLKETTTPVHAVKVSSPNKKRVSPPHGHGSVISSGSSAGLKSGRKFILRSVPSFPPLTPCIDSKVHAGQNVNDSKDCSRG